MAFKEEKQIECFTSFGKPVFISPKSNAYINKPGYKISFDTEVVEVLIGIGVDGIAKLLIDKQSWEALNAGETVVITTNKEFNRKRIKQ